MRDTEFPEEGMQDDEEAPLDMVSRNWTGSGHHYLWLRGIRMTQHFHVQILYRMPISFPSHQQNHPRTKRNPKKIKRKRKKNVNWLKSWKLKVVVGKKWVKKW